MIKIRLLVVGKVKEDYLKAGINEYIKRLKPYANIIIDEINDEFVNNESSAFEIEKCQKLEGEKILKLIKKEDYVIGLDLNKKEFDSISFSSYLIKSIETANSYLTFVIGGSYGFSKEVKERFNDSFSLSRMTFIHQMTRLILLEQIYRGFKIYRNETYHK